MQWSSQTEQQLADMVNRAHTHYRIDMYRRTYPVQGSHRPVQQQPVYAQQPRQYQPMRPRDALVSGLVLAVIIGFALGALWGGS